LFGGYSRYPQATRVWRLLERFPAVFRSGMAHSIRSISVNNWNRLATPARPFLSARKRNVGDKAHKLAELLNHSDSLSFYRRFITHWPSPEQVVVGGVEPANYFTSPVNHQGDMGHFESMMLADSLTYLPDDILVKVDRAAMGVSLETRVPFLDHRLVEFAWQLPLSMKVRDGQGKWVLRQVLYKYVPRELIERPKMGFGVPIDSWLRGPLRDWAECLLDESRLRREGFFNPVPIRQKWAEHLSGQRNWQYHLWDVLMFQAWLENESGSLAGRGAI
jgi:asparagine synthase (glutamine-hydrolysing)